ncbi:SpoIIE family protein phosphatase [Nocardioides marinquilinus]|uniref:SpoIIE family protein phosphatase n=1 Tax=Nocardioides marinquilinus TaxID=1210400 RepID=A0ABP9PZV7_9ACTN
MVARAEQHDASTGSAPDDDLPCGDVVLDADGVIASANAEFHRIVGREPGTVAGRCTLASLLPAGGRVYLQTHLWPVLQHDGVVREVSLDLLRPDETRVPVLVNARADAVVPGRVRLAVFETRERHRYEDGLLEASRAAERARSQAAALAQTLQATLIPPAPPAIPRLAVSATYRPAGDGTVVGGDFYDVFRVDAASWVIALGDVSGKGTSAAVVTSFVRYTIRALAVEHPDPADLLHELDRRFDRDELGHYCTVVLALLTEIDGRWRVRLALAGHPPALVRGRDGSVTELGEFGSAIGLFDEARFTCVEHTLADEVVTFYTDGVTEAHRGGELFGEAALGELIASAPHDPREVTARVADAVLTFQGGDASDDIAVISFAAAPQLP